MVVSIVSVVLVVVVVVVVVVVAVVVVSVFVQLSSNGRTGILSMVISWKFAQVPMGLVCFL